MPSSSDVTGIVIDIYDLEHIKPPFGGQVISGSEYTGRRIV
jgi:hypothetical protein